MSTVNNYLSFSYSVRKIEIDYSLTLNNNVASLLYSLGYLFKSLNNSLNLQITDQIFGLQISLLNV